MKLEIITPEKKLFEGSIKSVILPGTEGSFGILNDHAPLIGTLKNGKVEIIDESNNKLDFEISGGVVEVLENKVIVLAG